MTAIETIERVVQFIIYTIDNIVLIYLKYSRQKKAFKH